MKHTSTWTNLKINKTFDNGQRTIHNSYINGHCIERSSDSLVCSVYMWPTRPLLLWRTRCYSHIKSLHRIDHTASFHQNYREEVGIPELHQNNGFTKTEPLLTQNSMRVLWEFVEERIISRFGNVPWPLVLLTQVFVIYSCGIFISLVSIKTSPEIRMIWRMQFTVMFKELIGIVERCYEQLWKKN